MHHLKQKKNCINLRYFTRQKATTFFSYGTYQTQGLESQSKKQHLTKTFFCEKKNWPLSIRLLQMAQGDAIIMTPILSRYWSIFLDGWSQLISIIFCFHSDQECTCNYTIVIPTSVSITLQKSQVLHNFHRLFNHTSRKNA